MRLGSVSYRFPVRLYRHSPTPFNHCEHPFRIGARKYRGRLPTRQVAATLKPVKSFGGLTVYHAIWHLVNDESAAGMERAFRILQATRYDIVELGTILSGLGYTRAQIVHNLQALGYSYGDVLMAGYKIVPLTSDEIFNPNKPLKILP